MFQLVRAETGIAFIYFNHNKNPSALDLLGNILTHQQETDISSVTRDLYGKHTKQKSRPSRDVTSPILQVPSPPRRSCRYGTTRWPLSRARVVHSVDLYGHDGHFSQHRVSWVIAETLGISPAAERCVSGSASFRNHHFSTIGLKIY